MKNTRRLFMALIFLAENVVSLEYFASIASAAEIRQESIRMMASPIPSPSPSPTGSPTPSPSPQTHFQSQMGLPPATYIGGSQFQFPVTYSFQQVEYAPTVNPSQQVATNPGSPAVISFQGQQDPEGGPLEREVSAPPTYGQVTLVGPPDGSSGSYVYQPPTGFTGVDSFTYSVQDQAGWVRQVSVQIAVGESNPIVTAQSAEFTTPMGTAIDIHMGQLNQLISGSIPFTFPPIVQPAYGSLFLVSNPLVWIYRPNPGFSGTDSFVYEVAGPNGQKAQGNITIQVLPQPVQLGLYLGDPNAGGILVASADPAQGAVNFNLNTTELPNGEVTLYAVGLDSIGRQTVASSAFYVDNIPPTLSLTGQAPVCSGGISPWINVVGVANDNFGVARAERRNNAVNAPGVQLPDVNLANAGHQFQELIDTRLLPEGETTLNFFAFDLANNASLPASLQFKNDQSAPTELTLTLTPPETGTQNLVRGQVNIAAGAQDNGCGLASLKLVINGTVVKTVNTSTLEHTWNTSVDGVHHIVLEAVDVAGNQSIIEKTITVDNTDPVIAIQFPTNGVVLTSPLTTVSATAQDLNDVRLPLTILVNGTMVDTTVSGNQYTFASPLANNGLYRLSVKAEDKVGNVKTSAPIDVVIAQSDQDPSDDLSKDTVITIEDGESLSDQLTIHIDPTDAGSVIAVTISVDGSPPQAATPVDNTDIWNFPLDTTQLSDGDHTVSIVISYPSGPVQTHTIAIVVDNTDPVITRFLPANGETISGNVSIKTETNDNDELAFWDLYLDGDLISQVDLSGVTGAASYSLDTTVYSNGVHVLESRVTDQAGNATTQTSNVAISNSGGEDVVPDFDIVSPPDGEVVGGIKRINITITAGEAETVLFMVNGQTLPGESAAPNAFYLDWNTFALPAGPRTVEVIAVSPGGLSRSKTRQFVVDNTPPQIQVTFPGSNELSAGLFGFQRFDFVISGEANLKQTDIHFGVDANPVLSIPAGAPSSALIDLNNKALGAASVTFKAVDKAGNIGTAVVNFEIVQPRIAQVEVESHPARDAFVVSGVDDEIWVRVKNATIDPGIVSALGDEAIRVICRKNHQDHPLDGQVVMDGDRIRFLSKTSIPANAEISWYLNGVKTTEGELIVFASQHMHAISPLASETVTATAEDGRFKIDIPPASFSERIYLQILSPKDLPAQVAVADQTFGNTFQGYAHEGGPYYAAARKENGETVLLPQQPLRGYFEEPLQPLHQGRVLELQSLKEVVDGVTWQPLRSNLGTRLADQAAPNTQSTDGPIVELGYFRVMSLALPAPGLTNLFNFPNPFSPHEGGTTFNYFLGSDSKVDMYVYDLLGNLVRHLQFGAGGFGGTTGQNQVPWDGRNGEGDVVGNGGYIVQIFTKDAGGTEHKTRWKVGVVK